MNFQILLFLRVVFYLVFFGNKYVSFGFVDLFVELVVYVVGIVLVLMKGKLYNLGVCVYKIVM